MCQRPGCGSHPCRMCKHLINERWCNEQLEGLAGSAVGAGGGRRGPPSQRKRKPREEAKGFCPQAPRESGVKMGLDPWVTQGLSGPESALLVFSGSGISLVHLINAQSNPSHGFRYFPTLQVRKQKSEWPLSREILHSGVPVSVGGRFLGVNQWTEISAHR